jgi:intracellular sulfur oxidation DsrE/DsrF family protein
MSEKGKVLLLGKESVGDGDETMGFEILMNLLDSLAKRQEKPVALVFWNMAVQLLVPDSPAVGRLKVLEEQGVKIVAGRFCLQDLCIADTVAVGKGAGMEEILDLLFENEVISL